MFGFAKKSLLIAALACTGALTACLQDENKDPSQLSDAGKVSGSFFAAALGNTAVQLQNSVLNNPAWFTATNGVSISLANLGIDPKIGTDIAAAMCPTGGASPRVTMLTWFNSRQGNNFWLKDAPDKVGELMGSLRTRMSSDQLGTYEGGSTIRLANGNAMAIPAACTPGSLNVPLGAPVVALTVDRPAAPINELVRTEYRTLPCGNIAGMKQNGTQVQSRKVGFKTDSTIVVYVGGSPVAFDPNNPNQGWQAEAMGQCIPDVDVTATDLNTLTGRGSTALNNFADMAANGFRDILSNQLRMDCVKAQISSKTANAETGRLIKTDRMIDTCNQTALSNSGKTVSENLVDNSPEMRNLCPRNENENRTMLGNVSGVFRSHMAGSANVYRVIDKKNVTVDTTNRSNKRYVWLGGTAASDVSCNGWETFTARCNNVPGQPAGPDVPVRDKWKNHNLNVSWNNWNWSNKIFNICIGIFGDCEYIDGGDAKFLNMPYFNSKETKHSATDTTRARRDLSANTWSDRLEYFTANFNLPAGTKGWGVEPAANSCLIEKRELQRTCPLRYDAAKLDNARSPAKLDPNEDFMTTIIPGGSYGGYPGNYYDSLRQEGHHVGEVRLFRRTCNIKGCDRWTDTAGPGLNAHIESWRHSDTVSSGHNAGASASVQTIMMNKDGQMIHYKPTILSGPNLRYQGKYHIPLICGRIEKSNISWPGIRITTDCSGKGGCRTISTPFTETIKHTVIREWEGDNATNGTWSRPTNRYFSPSLNRTYGNTSNIPNPIVIRN